MWLGVRHDWTPGKLVRVERTYPRKWLADIYKPAAKAEERLRGVEVVIIGCPRCRKTDLFLTRS